MMGDVLIKDMEMPDRCFACPLCDVIDSEVNCVTSHGSYIEYREIDEQTAINGRPFDCPLIPVPPHGRLIDSDALHKLFEDQWHYLQVLDWNENPTAEAMQSGINWCINTMHDDAPTIIPAEEEV